MSVFPCGKLNSGTDPAGSKGIEPSSTNNNVAVVPSGLQRHRPLNRVKFVLCCLLWRNCIGDGTILLYRLKYKRSNLVIYSRTVVRVLTRLWVAYGGGGASRSQNHHLNPIPGAWLAIKGSWTSDATSAGLPFKFNTQRLYLKK